MGLGLRTLRNQPLRMLLAESKLGRSLMVTVSSSAKCATLPAAAAAASAGDEAEALDCQRTAFVDMAEPRARPFVSEFAQTQMFAQHVLAGRAPPAFQECSDAFLAERVASLSTSRRTPATTAEDLSLSMAARLEARMGGKKSALGGAMGSAAAATAAAAAAAGEAGGKDAAPAAPGACAAFPKGLHSVPPPQSAAAPPPTGFSYPDGPPRSFPESLAPMSSPLPRLKGEPPPPPPAVSAETRRAWAEALRSLEAHAEQRQTGQKIGASVSAVVGGALLAAPAVGCQVQ
mmetsp:Transcript_47376/g.153076  ORF Transcript_47376/g.153076 Transcript_47376/m.153076 type:complete len:289 (-) Transcript_47376:123-989(-)